MVDRYGLLGAGSGIAIALYVFSLIQKRSIGFPSRADSNQLLFLVFAVEWAMLALFVLAELLPSELQTCLKLLAVSTGAATAVLYVLCVMRLSRLGLVNSRSPAETLPHSGSRRRRFRSRIRAHD